MPTAILCEFPCYVPFVSELKKLSCSFGGMVAQIGYLDKADNTAFKNISINEII